MEETSSLKITEKIDESNKENKDLQGLSNEKKEKIFPITKEIKKDEINDIKFKEIEELINLNIHIDSFDKIKFIRKIFEIIAFKYFLFYSFIVMLKNSSIKKIILDNYYNELDYILQYSPRLCAILFLILLISVEFFKITHFNYSFFSLISLSKLVMLTGIYLSYNYYYQSIMIGFFLIFICSSIILIYTFIIKEEFSFIQLGLLVFFGQLIVVWFFLVYYQTTITNVMYIIYTFCAMNLLGNFLVYECFEIMEKFGRIYLINDYIFAIFGIYIDLIKMPYILLKKIIQNFYINFKKLDFNKLI